MSLLLLWMGTLQRKGCHSFSTAQGWKESPRALNPAAVSQLISPPCSCCLQYQPCKCHLNPQPPALL